MTAGAAGDGVTGAVGDCVAVAGPPGRPAALPPFDCDGLGARRARVVVVSAHPDDETLAVGGLLRALDGAGARLELVVATDGEAAVPSLDGPGRRALGRRRRGELTAALGRLGLDGVRPTWLGMPDTRLDRRSLADALRPIVAGADAVLAPWPNDPHCDHRAAGLAARDAAGGIAPVWCFPIWALVRGGGFGGPVPWDTAAGHRLSAEDLAVKAHALDAFASQMEDGPAGEPPVVDADARRHFEEPVEVLLAMAPPSTTPPARFAGLYRSDPDPWRTADSPYERRKRQVTLASLPRERYGSALDAGCGTGALTVEMAPRCDKLLAVDAVPGAVESARAATARLAHVRVEEAALPEGHPAGPFDLMVFSEVLYYLDRDDLAATLDRAARAAAPGADLVAVDWRPVTPDAPRDADDAHAQICAAPGWELLVEHCEAEFVLHVLRRVEA